MTQSVRQAQSPHFQRLMMARKHGVGYIINALAIVVTLGTLTGGAVSSQPRAMTCVD